MAQEPAGKNRKVLIRQSRRASHCSHALRDISGLHWPAAARSQAMADFGPESVLTACNKKCQITWTFLFIQCCAILRPKQILSRA